tara:strand:- start:44746 stop:44967 length:222 start_codon:yes stop_codon:yes gene_type:complete
MKVGSLVRINYSERFLQDSLQEDGELIYQNFLSEQGRIALIVGEFGDPRGPFYRILFDNKKFLINKEWLLEVE